MVSDPHAALRDRVLRRVLEGDAQTPPAKRRDAFERRAPSPDLKTLIEKIHDHAYKVTDADVATAQQVYGDDQLFEIIVSAALGASHERLQAGLKALADA
jgi:hypothetical protein